MQIREIMTRDVEVVPFDAAVKDAAAKMKQLDIGAIPVCDGQKLTGVLTDRDIAVRLAAEGRNPSDTRVSEIMTKDLFYCFEDQDVEEAATVMEAGQIRRLPILDQDRQLVGIVSLGDISVRSDDKEAAAEALEGISEPAAPKR
ncbi:MAG: CBS domain-containing protein [Deltaproteobacteria bacterium]|nr:CBS domain-containing protein [Deltaproteobacteria bacterium]